MATRVLVDDKLMRSALELGGFPSNRAAVETALRLYVQGKVLKQLEALGPVEFWPGYDPEEGEDVPGERDDCVAGPDHS